MKTLSFLLFIPFLTYSQQETLASPDKLFPEIHWNAQSPVKNQGMKNTCSAFGVAATLETFDGVPKDLSEKYLYAVQKANDYADKKETITGEYLSDYSDALIKYGAITEKEMPYNPGATQKWYKDDTEFVKYLYEGEVGFVTLIMNYKPKAKVFLNEYEFLDQSKCKNTEYLKSLLKNGIKAIPVSYQLYLPAWNFYKSTKFSTITPDSGYNVQSFTGDIISYTAINHLHPTDLADKIVAGNLKLLRSDANPDHYGNHVVTIIGYDDQGFIIKNSWSSDWRFNGYERVSFDFHKLFAYEALIIKSVVIKK